MSSENINFLFDIFCLNDSLNTVDKNIITSTSTGYPTSTRCASIKNCNTVYLDIAITNANHTKNNNDILFTLPEAHRPQNTVDIIYYNKTTGKSFWGSIHVDGDVYIDESADTFTASEIRANVTFLTI